MRQLLAATLCAAAAFAQTPAKSRNAPDIAFESVRNFLKFPPNIHMGEGIGVATNSKGHIFVYTRSQATRLFEFDAKGTYLRELGEGLYGLVFAHAVRVDPEDNVCEVYWTTPWKARQPYGVAVDLTQGVDEVKRLIEEDVKVYAATGHSDPASFVRQKEQLAMDGIRI